MASATHLGRITFMPLLRNVSLSVVGNCLRTACQSGAACAPAWALRLASFGMVVGSLVGCGSVREDLAQERLGAFVFRPGEERLWPRGLDDLAVIHEKHEIGDAPCQDH